jgi:hypothetical protein
MVRDLAEIEEMAADLRRHHDMEHSGAGHDPSHPPE